MSSRGRSSRDTSFNSPMESMNFSLSHLDGASAESNLTVRSGSTLYMLPPEEPAPPPPSAHPGQSASDLAYNHSTGSRNSQANQRVLKRRSLMVLGSISFALSFVSCILVVFIFMHQILYSYEEGNYEACVPVEELTTSENNQDPSLKLMTFKSNKYCAKTSDQMSAMIQLIISTSKNIEAPPPSPPSKFRFSPVSAHKFLMPLDPTGKTKDVPEVSGKRFHLRLDNSISPYQHARGVTCKNNSIIINHDGLYYIYSSIYFRNPAAKMPCSSYTQKTWGQYIHRHHTHNASRIADLVKASHTCCDHCTNDHHTSYAGGLFQLVKGDHIYVQLSVNNVAHFVPESTYMGLVMLTSKEAHSSAS